MQVRLSSKRTAAPSAAAARALAAGIAVLLVPAAGRAGPEEPEDAEPAPLSSPLESSPLESSPLEFLARYAPPPMDGPPLRLPEPLTRLYLDGGYARTDDLSALPLVAGKGQNIRFALGGTLRLGRFALEAELPFGNVTTLDLTLIPGVPEPAPPRPEDAHQTALSLGDLRLGATWTTPLGAGSSIVGGAGLRVRVPTHTVVFQFLLADPNAPMGYAFGQYRFPYYFHFEPTLILGGALGRLNFVVNQGALVMHGPDGNFDTIHFTVPTLAFWSAHYALVYAPADVIGFSLDLSTDIQLNHVAAMYFEELNDIRAVSLIPGVQIHLGAYRIDLVARLGLTRDAELFGVLQYAGTQSYMVRVGRSFN